MGAAACCAKTTTTFKYKTFENAGKLQDQVDHNAAVDYALKKNRHRENHSVHEMMLSCHNLPPTDIMGSKPPIFVIMYFDMHTLDDHDKQQMGGLTEKQLMMLNGEEPSLDDLEEGETRESQKLKIEAEI